MYRSSFRHVPSTVLKWSTPCTELVLSRPEPPAIPCHFEHCWYSKLIYHMHERISLPWWCNRPGSVGSSPDRNIRLVHWCRCAWWRWWRTEIAGRRSTCSWAGRWNCPHRPTWCGECHPGRRIVSPAWLSALSHGASTLHKQVWMYFRSGTDGRCCIGAGKAFVFNYQVAALCCLKWRHGRHPEPERVTSNRESDYVDRCIYLKNIPTKFHPDPIWNDGASG